MTGFISITLSDIRAQYFKEDFLGDDFFQYKGAFFKIKDNAASVFAHTFYGDLKYCQSSLDNNVIYPDSKDKFNTVKDSLVNRIFLVEDIIGRDGKTFSSDYYFEKPIFMLRDTTSKQVFYYFYDKQNGNKFPFLTSEIIFNINAFCSRIKKSKDDFTNEITINNPLVEGGAIAPVVIYKLFKNGRANYFLSMTTYGSTLSVRENGVIVLFEDGTKLSKPMAKIDVEIDNNGFKYSAFMSLTEIELSAFIAKKIKKFRLYIYDKDVDQSFAQKFTYYVKCVMDSK